MMNLDLEILLKTRLLLTASSGGGKTGALYAICEKFAGNVQIIVIDPEGEFAPLRTEHPFLLVGPDGEVPAMVKTAKLLAHRLLELNASAICDIYEMPVYQRHEFVRDFIEALVDAPKALWHPVLVIVDEAHVYAPEKGQGESVALSAMVDMASRGRKRGFALVAATQRLAKLSKNVASELQNQLVGRTTQVDQDRAADVLNLSKGKGREDFARMIGRMPTGEFIAYGMAFGVEEPTRITISRPNTLPVNAGRSVTPPPAPDSVRALLPKLLDLPAEVDKKQKTEADLRKEIVDLKKSLATPALLSERERMLNNQIQQLQAINSSLQANCARITSGIKVVQEGMIAIQAAVEAMGDSSTLIQSPPAITLTKSKPTLPSREKIREKSDGDVKLTGPEQRILDALEWFEGIGVDQPENTAVAFIAGYTAGGGAYNNPRGRLKQQGMIEYVGNKVMMTALGRALANPPEIELTSEALHEAVLSRLPGPESKILRVLLNCYPKSMSNNHLAEASGYAAGGGAYNNPRGRLKTLGLIEYIGKEVRARGILFPDR